MKDEITALSVCGYKSIYNERSIGIRPLTILAGANSSGKSSIIQPLLLFKQTLEASFDPGALLLDGPNVKFAYMEQLFSYAPGRYSDDFHVGLDIGQKEKIKLSYRIEKKSKGKRELEVYEMSYSDSENEMVLRPEMTHKEIKKALKSNKRVQIHGDFEIKMIRDRCFLELGIKRKETEGSIYSLVPIFSHYFKSKISKIIHLPGYRGNPGRNYPAATVKEEYPGTFQQYFASIIASWDQEKDDRLKELGSTLRQLGLTWKVKAKYVDDTKIEVLVGRLPEPTRSGAHDLVSIADVGFGISQVLPVIVALLAAERGQMLFIEEPEIHLHPNAQYLMASVLADAALRGVIVIIETHSTLLLRGIQTLVAEGYIPQGHVKLHWFTRDSRDGSTDVDVADLNELGAYGDWPQDFDDVTLRVEKDYLDAVGRRRASK